MGTGFGAFDMKLQRDLPEETSIQKEGSTSSMIQTKIFYAARSWFFSLVF